MSACMSSDSKLVEAIVLATTCLTGVFKDEGPTCSCSAFANRANVV